ncbi:MAG: phosphoribosylformylglycinamidine cyclo-ligase [Inquilinus sp.]|nr:phosphoribosylformylglycinamidine cyclo-ligase [Inquilinus sp.]
MPTPAKDSDPYKAAGVDIAKGKAFVDAIAGTARDTGRPGVVGGLGGFGALFDPRAAGFRDPILVAATDGVGTKLSIAIETGRHDTIGTDLVAMCVNDLAVQGAEPLFFLDYFATGELEPAVAESVVRGIGTACRAVGCALIGGETAEMPGLYAAGDYDLAGFAVGAVERGRQITGEAVAAGDVVLGLPSSGVHSNGFSLVRRVVRDSGVAYGDPAPFAPAESLGAALLTPTRLYSPAMVALARAGLVHAFAHITGGGLLENIPRALPDGLGVRLDAARWPFQPVFAWLQARGGLDAADMALTFNCGIGLAIVIGAEHKAAATALLRDAGETVFEIGAVVATSGPRVVIDGADALWSRAAANAA